MKLPRVLIILLVGLVIVSKVEAISLQGLTSSGILGPNAHTHISTTPIRIYAITITTTAAEGNAWVIQTNSAGQDASYTDDGRSGQGYVTGRESYVKADLYGATANSSYHFEYPDGINVDEQCFVSSTSAMVEIYYKQE